MSIFNTVDYVIMVLLLLGGIGGAIKGFLEEIAQKFGLVLGLVASLMFTKSLVPIVAGKISAPNWIITGICYVVIFIVGYLVMKLIGSLLQLVFKSDKAGVIDAILGFFLGVFELVLLCGIIISLLQNQTLFNIGQYFKDSYLCSKFITPFFNWIYGLVQKAF